MPTNMSMMEQTYTTFAKIKKPSVNYTTLNKLIEKWQKGPLYLALHRAVPFKMQTEHEILVPRVPVNSNCFAYDYDKYALYNTANFSFAPVTLGVKSCIVTSWSLGTRWCDASCVLVTGSIQYVTKVVPGTTLHFAPQSLIIEI